MAQDLYAFLRERLKLYQQGKISEQCLLNGLNFAKNNLRGGPETNSIYKLIEQLTQQSYNKSVDTKEAQKIRYYEIILIIMRINMITPLKD